MGKTELHQHLDGSIPPAKIWSMMRRHGLNPVSSLRELRKLLTILSQRLRRANAKMESLAYMDVAGRLARYLLDLARDHGQRMGNGWVVVRRPTHSDIAHSIGTSRETVSRLINEFEEGFGLVNKGKFTYIRESLIG